MEFLRKLILLTLVVCLTLCIAETEGKPPRNRRPHYSVTDDDAEAAASDWSDQDEYDRRPYHHGGGGGGVTGPVHTFVKTDKHANYKWGVRHHVGPKYTK